MKTYDAAVERLALEAPDELDVESVESAFTTQIIAWVFGFDPTKVAQDVVELRKKVKS